MGYRYQKGFSCASNSRHWKFNQQVGQLASHFCKVFATLLWKVPFFFGVTRKTALWINVVDGFFPWEDAEETPEPKKDHEKKREAAEVWCNYDSEGPTWLISQEKTYLFSKMGDFPCNKSFFSSDFWSIQQNECFADWKFGWASSCFEEFVEVLDLAWICHSVTGREGSKERGGPRWHRVAGPIKPIDLELDVWWCFKGSDNSHHARGSSGLARASHRAYR